LESVAAKLRAGGRFVTVLLGLMLVPTAKSAESCEALARAIELPVRPAGGFRGRVRFEIVALVLFFGFDFLDEIVEVVVH